DPAQTHTATIDWGDGTISSGSVSETNGSGTVSGSYTYNTPGVYTLKLTVTNAAGVSGESIFQYIVIYDPDGGFVTGGGWINSPAGAYTPDPSLTGKANFGFVSKYKKGANTPTGNTQFRFKAADLNFHSDSYEWLVVAGHKAKFKGSGTINGVGNYGFMLTATDEALTPSTDIDRFRIKIWDKDNGDAVVYDNQMGDADDAEPATAIGGGSIIIHQ
ncbi:PKD domain-containing protein, partial [Chloroflexota bacterium]